MGRRNDGGTPPQNPGGDPGDGGSSGEVFTEEQRRELDRIVNGAHKTHSQRLSRSFDSKMDELRAGIGSMLEERLPKPPAPTKVEVKSDDPKGAQDALRSEYEARFKAVEEDNRRVREEAEAERAKAREQQERGALREALVQAGVPEGLQRGAIAALYTEDKRIGRSEDGSVVFKMQRAGYVDDLALDKGIGEWLETDEGKYYRPARQVAGSGARGPTGAPQAGRQANGKPTRRELKQRLVHAFLNAERTGGM